MAAPLAAGSPLADISPEAAINTFLHTLRRPLHLMVAISGGSDSTGLLLSLKRAIEAQRFPHTHSLSAATIDHGLRTASADEARRVAVFCESLDIPHRIARWSGPKPKQGLSAAARQARYSLLAEVADAVGADAIVTGHTLDDQIETVAMRADRSAEGAVGLAGMAPATLYAGRLWILRPYLRTRRQDIRNYLDGLQQPWIDDPSNEDPCYERVRVRLAAPAVDPAVIEEAADHRKMLSLAAALWLEASGQAANGPVVAISLTRTTVPSPDVRDHALSALAAILGGKPHRPAAASLARLTAALEQNTDFRLTLSGSLVLRRGNTLFLLRERRGLLPLLLPPFSRAVWDGRYSVENTGDTEVMIIPGPGPAIASELPGIIRAALAETSPQVVVKEGSSEEARHKVIIRRRLSLFADFMPGFDKPLADTIARLIGAEPTPSAPI